MRLFSPRFIGFSSTWLSAQRHGGLHGAVWKKGERKRAKRSAEREARTRESEAEWGFVTVGGVGFEGGFGVGCADSSTLSSVPRSTGGYASLHTFTIHAHACERLVHRHTQISTCVTTRPFFSFGSRSTRLRLHTCAYTHSHNVVASATSFPFLSLSVSLSSLLWPRVGRSCACVSRHIV